MKTALYILGAIIVIGAIYFIWFYEPTPNRVGAQLIVDQLNAKNNNPST